MFRRNRSPIAVVVATLAVATALVAPAAGALSPKTAVPFSKSGMQVLAVTPSPQSTCALLKGGQVKCWGSSNAGQLGVGDTRDRGKGPNQLGDYLVAVNLGAGRTAKSIDSGGWHECAILDNGSLKCWGYNGDGALGLGNTTSRGDRTTTGHEMGDLLPAVDLGTGVKLKAVAAGDYSTCAIVGKGSVVCWGSNDHGQLGIGDNSGDKADIGDQAGEMGNNLAAVDLGTGRKAKALAGGTYFNCALLDNGAVKCWGANDFGQSGLGDSSGNKANIGDQPNEMGNNLPAIDLGTGRKAKAIGAGWQFACALLDNGTVKCWGDNAGGEIGLGDSSGNKAIIGDQPNEMGNNLPAIDLGTGRKAKAIAVGGEFVCAVLDNKQVKCWGWNVEGELGYGDTNNRGDNAGEMGDNLPAVDLGTGVQAKSLVSGGGSYHTCAVLTNAAVKCWGKQQNGELGYGDMNNRGDEAGEMGDNLQNVNLGVQVKTVQATGGGGCATLQDNSTECWGWNGEGETGNGDSSGSNQSLGNQAAEMGNSLPSVNLGTGRTVKTFANASLGWSNCAILDNKALKCWGWNADGQLGYGDTDNRGDGAGETVDLLPAVDLGTGRTAKSVATGGNEAGHTCAVLDNGQVKCWGSNQYGQLGIGDITGDKALIGNQSGEMGNALQAVNLGKRRKAKQVVVGEGFSCALLDNSKVKCWGQNQYGQLGIGDNAGDKAVIGDAAAEMGDALAAVDFGPRRKAKLLSAGLLHVCALLDNGSVKCWGYNSEGELGLGDTERRGDGPGEMGSSLLPVDLGTGRKAKAIASAGYHVCALLDNGTVKCWGRNMEGELGLGDAESRGDGPGEMGNSLLPVDLGTGRKAKSITTGLWHTCARLDNGTVKCWGFNTDGELGSGDGAHRGDGANEMGDYRAPVAFTG